MTNIFSIIEFHIFSISSVKFEKISLGSNVGLLFFVGKMVQRTLQRGNGNGTQVRDRYGWIADARACGGAVAVTAHVLRQSLK